MSDKIILECFLTDTYYNVALPVGYDESKHVGERMLALVAKRAGVKFESLRLGQAAGPIAPENGAWIKSEWVPNLIQTSRSLGCITDALMDVDWIPSDILAHVIVDRTHQDHEGI